MIFVKLMKYIIIILSLILVLEISLVTLDKKFFEKASQEEATRQGLTKDDANAIKHAYAASLVYSGLRFIFLGDESARDITIYFGKLNEIAEIIFKTNRDSTLEMMKDLKNNLVGINAAITIKKINLEDRLGFIGKLAKNNVLVLSQDDLQIADNDKNSMRKTHNYKMAEAWFNENYERMEIEITNQIRDALKE